MRTYIRDKLQIQLPTKDEIMPFSWMPRAFRMPIWAYFIASGMNAIQIRNVSEKVPFNLFS